MNIGFRDDRLNDRCIGCKHKHPEMQDWCTKWHENPHYCVVTCILKHPNCSRDNPAIKTQIQLYLYQRIMKTDCRD
jgi:hypothetical protein